MSTCTQRSAGQCDFSQKEEVLPMGHPFSRHVSLFPLCSLSLCWLTDFKVSTPPKKRHTLLLHVKHVISKQFFCFPPGSHWVFEIHYLTH